MVENYDCIFLLIYKIYKTPNPIYSTSVPDNVATFNTLLQLILEIHLGLALLLLNVFKVYYFYI